MGDTSNATEKVYLALKTKITSGEMEAGSHLGAAVIAERLETSRTPVREAFNRLAAEGLVTVVPNRGAYVTEWSSQDSEEIFELRFLLEGHAASLAAKKISPQQLSKLRDLAAQMERVSKPGLARDLQALAILNVEFHKTIIAASGNKRLGALIATVFEFAIQSQTFRQYSEAELRRSMRHHNEIIAALSAGDSEWASSVIRSHYRAARHVYQDH